MQLIKRVIAAGFLELVMSSIVLREYETRRLSDLKSRIQGARDNLREVSKIFTKSGKKISTLESLDSKLNDTVPELTKSLNETYESWLKDFKVKVLDPDPEIYSKVWVDYFTGIGAFKKPKNRDDIPDAVIGRSIENLINDGKPLVFICKDGQLKNFMSGFKNVIVFDDLAGLIGSEEFSKILKDLDAQDKIIDEFKSAIGSDIFLNNLIKYLSADKSDFEYAYWDDEMVENQGELPLPALSGVRAGGPIVTTIENINFGTVSCISPRHYVINLEFTAMIPVGFVGQYIDWINAPKDIREKVFIDSAQGDGLCDFSTVHKSTVTGEIVVHLLENELPQNLLVHSKYIGTDESPLDIEFVPNKVIL